MSVVPTPWHDEEQGHGHVLQTPAWWNVTTSLPVWGPEPPEAGLEMPTCRLSSVTSALGSDFI